MARIQDTLEDVFDYFQIQDIATSYNNSILYDILGLETYLCSRLEDYYLT